MAAPDGVKRALAEAVAERGDAPPVQPGLFAEPEAEPAPPAVDNRGGRPLGARSRASSPGWRASWG